MKHFIEVHAKPSGETILINTDNIACVRYRGDFATISFIDESNWVCVTETYDEVRNMIDHVVDEARETTR